MPFKEERSMRALLVLEDGSTYEGRSIGVQGERIGEVVMNTSVVGYQEMMTDPAHAGKILVLTYPLIGNYGIAKKFNESRKCWIEALVIKEESAIASNWQSEGTFDAFLKEEGLFALSGVDTRTLAVRIRERGEMLGIISTKAAARTRLVNRLKTHKKKGLKKDFIRQISVDKITEEKGRSSCPRVGIIDLGMPRSFIAQLKALGCSTVLMPYDTDARRVLSLDLDGLIVSSGPEDDEAIPKVTNTVRSLIGKVPLLGISTGHEIICRARGWKLKKMKTGHRGVNYPVLSPGSFKGDITVQNHSFVLDDHSMKPRGDATITLRNANDRTVEEVVSASLKFISAQYYPASPGFGEVHPLFKRFIVLMKGARERNPVCQSAKI